MTPEDASVARWREAAGDLGIRFVAPFTLSENGDSLSYLGWLPEFGSIGGLLIISEDYGDMQSRLIRLAKEHGFAYSCMTPHLGPYDRDVIVDVLNDWGWTSPQLPPSWYIADGESDAEI